MLLLYGSTYEGVVAYFVLFQSFRYWYAKQLEYFW